MNKKYWFKKQCVRDEEYSILVNAAKTWGKNDPKKFIDYKIKEGRIKYNDNGNITEVDLKKCELCNIIYDQIFSLIKLEILDLSDNSLQGSIPELTKAADLDDPQLQFLKELKISNNQLNGSIPVRIGFLSSLEILDLSSNHLSDPIPISIGNISSLKILDLSKNKLSGSIPESVGCLSKLVELKLD